jgi:hypothetical protein
MAGSIAPKLLPIAPAPNPEPNILKGLLCESAGIPPNPAKGLALGVCVVVVVVGGVPILVAGVVVGAVVVVVAAKKKKALC